MTVFVDTNATDDSVTLEIRENKIGQITGKTINEVSLKLLGHLSIADTAYVDVRGLGASVADILSRYVEVIRVCPSKHDIIKADFLMVMKCQILI